MNKKLIIDGNAVYEIDLDCANVLGKKRKTGMRFSSEDEENR